MLKPEQRKKIGLSLPILGEEKSSSPTFLCGAARRTHQTELLLEEPGFAEFLKSRERAEVTLIGT